MDRDLLRNFFGDLDLSDSEDDDLEDELDEDADLKNVRIFFLIKLIWIIKLAKKWKKSSDLDLLVSLFPFGSSSSVSESEDDDEDFFLLLPSLLSDNQWRYINFLFND